MTAYDIPDEIQVEADGPIRVVRLNRPDQLNATNHELHRGLAELFPQIDADEEARAVVLTGNGRAFSAGGDFNYLDELANDADKRKETLAHGRQIVTGMVACRVPIVAAVNGPAVGLGCSLVALSDIVFMAESCPPGRSPRGLGPGGRRRGPGDLATHDQPAAGQGVRPDRRSHPGGAGGADRSGQPRLSR